MGAARRLCGRAVVLAGMISAIVSLALPACQFPDYGRASGGQGGAGAPAGGVPGDSGGPAGGRAEGGEAGEGREGGASGSADGGAGGAETAAMPCPIEACVPKAPAGWLGPIAFWDAIANSAIPLPVCPEGYTKPVSLHHGVDMPTDGCRCTCTAQDQVCSTNTTLYIYDDQKCEGTPCGSVSPLVCDGVSGCVHSQGTLKAAIPTPSGGTCNGEISPPAPASWQYDSRACAASGAHLCADSSRVCAPVPTSPYASRLCVMNVVGEGQSLPECPAPYRNGSKTLYESFSDMRHCSACGCSGVTGGSCTGSKLSISADGDCTSGVEYKLGAGCQPFTLTGNNAHPTSVGTEYSVTAGTCKVVSPSATIGNAPTIGQATLVCCQ